MFLPQGYQEIRTAAFLLPERDGFGGFEWQLECIGRGLASGELVGHGIVVARCGSEDDPPEMGELRPLRPEVWRTQLGRDAVFAKHGEGRLRQDDFILAPIIQETALFAWDNGQSQRQSQELVVTVPSSSRVPGLSPGVHAIPEGYVTFDAIGRVARRWANEGKIDPDLMLLLEPLDSDSMTQALATGSLRAFGINKRTGQVVPLPPQVWRIEVSGAPQAIWAIAGADVFAGPDGDSCIPVIARADLARCFQATEIPRPPRNFRRDGTKPFHFRAISSLPNRTLRHG